MQNAYVGRTLTRMPVNITIRNVPNEVHDELAARAALSGQSLQEYLSRELAAMVSRPSMTEVILRTRMRAKEMPPVTIDEILEHLHSDRR